MNALAQELTPAERRAQNLERRGQLAELQSVGLTAGVALLPRDLSQAMDFGRMMAKSGIALPKHLRENEGACMAVAMQAWRWELDPFLVGSKSYCVNDIITYEAQLVMAVLNTRAPIKGRLRYEFDGEDQSRRVTVSAICAETGEVLKYQSPPLHKIKKHSPSWVNDPDQQLVYYGSRALARRFFPEILLGVYSADEIRESAPMADVTPLRQVEAAPVDDDLAAALSPVKEARASAEDAQTIEPKDGARLSERRDDDGAEADQSSEEIAPT